MSDTPDDTLPKRRRSAPRKAAKASVVVNEPAVQAILDQALHPDTLLAAVAEVAPPPELPATKRRPPRKRAQKRARKIMPQPDVELAEAATPALMQAPEPRPAEPDVDAVAAEDAAVEMMSAALADTEPMASESADADGEHAFIDLPPAATAPPPGQAHPPALDAAPEPSHHHWVYLALAVFLLALGFGLWGVWTTWFAGDDASNQDATALRVRSDKLSQDVSTLRRSDQISREANRDLERALAERDEEIAGLRADIAFYERFVGATGQRRGLSVHDLDMQLQSGDAWHFVATLTQNLNRGAVNAGRVMLSVEGTRNDRLEKLSWSSLRKQTNAPGESYSFKYFQQVEGEVMLPKDFKPLRVTVRLVPAGGSAVEQSFPWPDTVRGGR
jgi:hypothetical protein